MVKIFVLIAIAASLSGCVMLTKQEARSMSTIDLCYRITTSSYPEERGMLVSEVMRRGGDCNAHAEKIQDMQEAAQRRARAKHEKDMRDMEATQRILESLNQSRRAYAPPPPPINCTSRRIFDRIETQCW